jgi:hypothetical protein
MVGSAVVQHLHAISWVCAAEQPVDADLRRSGDGAEFLFSAGGYYFEHDLQAGCMSLIADLAQCGYVRADILESDKPQAGPDHLIKNSCRLRNCAIVMSQHEHEFDHGVPFNIGRVWIG